MITNGNGEFPLTIPLNEYERLRLEGFDREIQALELRRAECITTIIAGVLDPKTVAGFGIRFTDAGLVILAPAMSNVE